MQKMVVLFDFYEIALGKGKSIGIYNYALAVLRTLAKESDKLLIIVACSDENLKEIKVIPNIQILLISKKYPNFWQRFKWRYFKVIPLAQKKKADIYYSPKGFSPVFFKRKKKPFVVLTIHDMIPFYYKEKFPSHFSKFENEFITRTLRQSANSANKIITISAFSKEMILKYANPKTDINVIYNGVSSTDQKEGLHITSPYIFAITSSLPHKNKENILNGYIEYRKISTNPLPLKICGITSKDLDIPQEYLSEIECISFADEVIFSKLFSNASLFIFLPLIEGFGFPPLEAIMFHVPSVVADISVLKEVLGQSAYYVDPTNPKKIGVGINSVLTNSKLTNILLKNGQEIITKYDWADCCSQMIDVFEKTVTQDTC